MEKISINNQMAGVDHRNNRQSNRNIRRIEDTEIKLADMGFWDKDGNYTPDWQIVDLRKE